MEETQNELGKELGTNCERTYRVFPIFAIKQKLEGGNNLGTTFWFLHSFYISFAVP